MTLAEIRKLSAIDLKASIGQDLEKLHEFEFKKGLGELKQSHQVSRLKHLIAAKRTILREQQLAEESADG